MSDYGLYVWAENNGHETTPAGAGDIVRRKGFRRTWRITGNDGQLVAVESLPKPPRGHQRHRDTIHASELVLVRRAGK